MFTPDLNALATMHTPSAPPSQNPQAPNNPGMPSKFRVTLSILIPVYEGEHSPMTGSSSACRVWDFYYISLLCSSWILCNLYVLPVGKPSWGVGTDLNVQYPQKSLYLSQGYGFSPGTGAGMTSGTQGFTRAVA
jgi:hypothetical protein